MRIVKLFLLFRLNERQIDKLSDIASDLGLVAVASVILPAVFDKYNSDRVTLGLVIALVCWIYSMWLRK